MKHFSAYQWTIGAIGILAYFRWLFRLWRDARSPKIELTRFQRATRITGAFVFGIALLVAIPYWLGLWS